MDFSKSWGQCFYASEVTIGDAAHDIVCGELFRSRFRLILSRGERGEAKRQGEGENELF